MKQPCTPGAGVKVVLLVALLTGCATIGVDLSENGTVRLDVRNASHVEFTNVYVRQYTDELMVHAELRPRDAVKFFYPGHLRFVMTDADGKTLWNLDVTRYTDGHHNDGMSKIKHANFWVRMPFSPPTGSVLTISHHTFDMEGAQPGESGFGVDP